MLKDDQAGDKLHKFIPESSWNLILAEKQEFLVKIQKLEYEVKEYKEKENKYERLICALKNRGYPIEEVYSKDVMWLGNEELPKSSTPERRSRSMMKDPFDLSSSSSSIDQKNN